MPELPEVETIRRGLERRLVGARIASVVVREPRLRRPVDVARLRTLVGRTVQAVRRRGKYLVLDVGDGLVWLIHLGMSGRVMLAGPDAPVERHEHIRVELRGSDPMGSDPAVLRYSDPRRFGLMRVGREKELPELAGLGPEPLAEALDRTAVSRRLRATRRQVKVALLDQRLLAGIGNIYANEILFRAGVRPTRRGVRVKRAEAARILESMREVLSEAVERRGTSFSDYFDSDGIPGTFQTVLAVFDREGKACFRCGSPIRRHFHGGRSSFYCAGCQR